MRRFFESLYLWAKLMYLDKNIDFDEDGESGIDWARFEFFESLHDSLNPSRYSWIELNQWG